MVLENGRDLFRGFLLGRTPAIQVPSPSHGEGI
jgi:hypothetical protein